jgi:hypothetical protein
VEVEAHAAGSLVAGDRLHVAVDAFALVHQDQAGMSSPCTPAQAHQHAAQSFAYRAHALSCSSLRMLAPQDARRFASVVFHAS